MTATTVQRQARGDVPKLAGRAGLAARGALYCIAALLALRLVLGANEQVNRQAALQRVVEQPLGKLLVGVLAVGFAGYALWRFARAATGAKEGGKQKDGAADISQRAGDVGRGLLYVALLATALRVLTDSGGASGGDRQEKEWTARLMAATGGRWLVGIAGLVVLGGGIYLVAKGVRMTFDDKLRCNEMSPWERTWLPRLGILGYSARGVVFALIGFFLVRAAWTYNPNEAVGVDGALRRLLEQTAGRALVLAVAVGLLAFGLFSFVEARWRKVLEG